MPTARPPCPPREPRRCRSSRAGLRERARTRRNRKPTDSGPWAYDLSLVRIGELFASLAAGRLAELEQAAGLDMADAFAGDPVEPGHLGERQRGAIPQPEAQC